MVNTTEVGSVHRPYFKDFARYAFWWCLWLGLLAFFQYTDVGAGQSMLALKAFHLGYGVIVGLVCALVFTALQNTLNPARGKVKAWAFAIGTWLLIALSSAALFSSLR